MVGRGERIHIPIYEYIYIIFLHGIIYYNKILSASVCFVLSFRPYIIDLDSSNGTFLNNNKIEARRYFELKEKV